MMSSSVCLPRSATDNLGLPVSTRPAMSYTISWDIIAACVGCKSH